MPTNSTLTTKKFHQFLKDFRLERTGRKTKCTTLPIGSQKIPVFINEFWTSKQRQAHSLHEISYRACFKPQLPAFFINLFTKPHSDWVYDPFNGRGTTAVEAALLQRFAIGNDVNPLSRILSEPRTTVPSIVAISERLNKIPSSTSIQTIRTDIDLSMFFEERTLSDIYSLREYFIERSKRGESDFIDRWIRMVATNRLTGHSKGFFSVYSLPPNQAMSAPRQQKLNVKLGQNPEYRDVKDIILKKSKALMKDLKSEEFGSLKFSKVNVSSGDSANTPSIKDNSISLTVTSPPFLDVVQYIEDNWLRCWFNNIDAEAVQSAITISKTLPQWGQKMYSVLQELYRVTKPGGIVAFEVGEVKNKGKIVYLEETIIPLGLVCGFTCDGLLINQQKFTKTANLWGVKNNSLGTNSNRIVVFKK